MQIDSLAVCRLIALCVETGNLERNSGYQKVIPVNIWKILR